MKLGVLVCVQNPKSNPYYQGRLFEIHFFRIVPLFRLRHFILYQAVPPRPPPSPTAESFSTRRFVMEKGTFLQNNNAFQLMVWEEKIFKGFLL